MARVTYSPANHYMSSILIRVAQRQQYMIMESPAFVLRTVHNISHNLESVLLRTQMG